jgi:hypothetical protein
MRYQTTILQNHELPTTVTSTLEGGWSGTSIARIQTFQFALVRSKSESNGYRTPEPVPGSIKIFYPNHNRAPRDLENGSDLIENLPHGEKLQLSKVHQTPTPVT